MINDIRVHTTVICWTGETGNIHRMVIQCDKGDNPIYLKIDTGFWSSKIFHNDSI